MSYLKRASKTGGCVMEHIDDGFNNLGNLTLEDCLNLLRKIQMKVFFFLIPSIIIFLIFCVVYASYYLLMWKNVELILFRWLAIPCKVGASRLPKTIRLRLGWVIIFQSDNRCSLSTFNFNIFFFFSAVPFIWSNTLVFIVCEVHYPSSETNGLWQIPK